ncbi:hypothetical protein ACA910_016496 [Epithemia clementina (nom. ined.)]
MMNEFRCDLMKRLRSAVLVSCATTFMQVVAFAPLPLHSFRHHYPPGSALDRQRPAHGSALQAQVELVFNGDYTGRSDPLPPDTTKEAAVAFLMQDSTRDLFFSAGNTRKIELVETSPELLEMWNEVVEFYGYERKPTVNDPIITVDSIVQFPGLKLITTAVSGVYVMTNKDTGFEEYHFFSIADKQTTQGFPPAVWLYDQLTGSANKDKDKFSRMSGNARSVVSVVEHLSAAEAEDSSSGDEPRLCFSFDVILQIVVKFPSALLKIIPSSTEKMEEQGSKSIQKAVSKDVDLALLAAAQAFATAPLA